MWSAVRSACFEEAIERKITWKNSKMKQQRSVFSKLKQNFNLNGISEVYFWKSEWEAFDPEYNQTPISNIFIFYRVLYLIYFYSTLNLSLVCSDTPLSLWTLYFTHWSYTIQTLYALFAMLVVIVAKCYQYEREKWSRSNRRRLDSEVVFIGYSQDPKLSIMSKITWILLNLANSMSVGVTIIYWGFLNELDPTQSTCSTVSNYFVHGTNSVAAIIDIFVIAVPIHLTHVLFPFVFSLFYILFMIFYEIGGGVYKEGEEYIYKILNWKNHPTSAAIVSIVLVLVVLPMCHFLFCWVLSKLRSYLANKLTNKNYNSVY